MSNEKNELQKVSATEKELMVSRPYAGGTLQTENYVDGYGYGQGYDSGNGFGDDENDITGIVKDIWRSVRSHKLLIISIPLVVTAIAFVEVSRIRSTYTAFTQIEIRRDNSVMASPLADSDPQNIVIINTKMLMFDSRPLLEAVIVENGLDRDTRFVDVDSKRSRMATVKKILGIEEPKSQSGNSQSDNSPSATQSASAVNYDPADTEVENKNLDRYVNILKAGKKVEHLVNTSALKVSFKHANPEIAQIVADALTQSFIENNLNTKLEKFDASKKWLDRSTRQIESQVQRAEQDLNNFTRAHGIFSIGEGGQDSLTLTKLARMNDQVSQVQRDLMTKELAYNEVKQGRVRQLPQLTTDPRVSAFQSKLDELKREEAKLENDFGPEFPRVKEIKPQIAKLEEQLALSVKDLEDRIVADYERTKKDFDSLQVHLQRTESEALQKDQAAITYSVLKQKLDSAKSLYTELLQKQKQVDLEAAQQRSNITVLRPAELPHSPDGVDPVSASMLAFAAALAGSIGLAYLLDRFDTTIKNTGDVSRYAQLPTLGLIPSIAGEAKQLVSRNNGERRARLSIPDQASGSNNGSSSDFSHRFLRSSSASKYPDRNGGTEQFDAGSDNVVYFDERSPVAEAYRVLRTSMLLSSGGHPPKIMLFTSGQPGEGKTTTVINTAISLAHLGSSVLIIDADLRKPATHKGFNLKQSHGLSTYLSRDADLDGLIQKLHIPNLSLLPCGPVPQNPAELISSEKMKDMLNHLASRYDHILIDSPPLMYVTDPVILSTLVDGVVLVVQGGKSRREVVRISRQMLDNVGAKVFGVVLNNMKPNKHSDGELGYFKYYAQYGEQERKEERVSDILKGM